MTTEDRKKKWSPVSTMKKDRINKLRPMHDNKLNRLSGKPGSMSIVEQRVYKTLPKQ